MYEIQIMELERTLTNTPGGYYILIVYNSEVRWLTSNTIAWQCDMYHKEYISLLKRYGAVYRNELDQYIFETYESAKTFEKEVVEPKLVMRLLSNS